MELVKTKPTVKAPAERFTGDVWLDVIARGEEPSRIRASVVRFAPGARNAWHAHAVGQTLHVTEGVGRIQARGGDGHRDPPRRHDPHAARRVALARRGARPVHDPSRDLRGAGGGSRDRVGRAGQPTPSTSRRRRVGPMTGWTADELDRIGEAEELRSPRNGRMAALRRSIDDLGRPRRRRPLRAVGPRLATTRGSAGRCTGEGRIRAAASSATSRSRCPGPGVAAAVTAAYHAKYDHYGPGPVGTVVTPEAIGSTLRITQR